ncbi:acetyl-CoA carboxylase biotin carboxyl carrier protein subunit [Aureimonas endophytica]|uniref:Biotin carboxyl carrier protein of acetyl-CoA carboxylase n=1 Tax=Aureimonas endophytica TaxID=2027858 RepID=A0A916ZCI7_9HYPH|nr:acetyl-CoA carboxylase biotin carboxyl carrier protein [Aureimonas endophytica]GGD88498.1 acetyl-CoA carboxylase biotin carboxyl carrier protein subunit [Aureimonas endophytica]
MSTKENSIDRELVRELADILNDTDLTEIEIEQGPLRIRVSRKKEAPAMLPPGGFQMMVPPAAMPAAAPVAAAAPAAAPAPATGPEPGSVPSPMVGTVYLAPSPDAKPFIEVGQTVAEGDTLLIIEAMKTMNQIPAPRAGKIVRICVDNSQPVEYGEALVVIG